MEAFRDGFCKTMDYSPGTSFQLSFDDDHEPPLEMTSSAPLTPRTRVSWKVPPVSLDQEETALSSFEDTAHDDTARAGNHDVEAGTGFERDMVDDLKVNEDICETSRSIMEQPVIKDALNKYVGFYYKVCRKTELTWFFLAPFCFYIRDMLI